MIRKSAPMNKHAVVLYGTRLCPWCALAREFLRKRNVPFLDVYVDKDTKAEAAMVKKSGQHHVPVIDTGKKIIVGYDEGELQKLAKKR